MSEFIDKAKATIGAAADKVDEKVPDSVKVKASDYADKAGVYANKAGVVAVDTVDKLVEKLPDSVKEKVEPIVSKVKGKGKDKSDGTDTPADEPGPDTPTA
jgi:hypothetical protein